METEANEMTKKPSYRFRGYEDEWKQQKASEIFYSVSDKNHVDLPVLSASQEHGMIKRDEIGIDIKYNEASVKTYKRVKPGQFVIHLRSFQGGFAYSDIEGITSPAYTVLDFSKSNKHFDLFWKEVFTSQNFIKRLETVTYGIRDGRSISFSDFSSLKLQFPSHPEQTSIGSFFQDIDQLISLQQRKLEVLKEQKKTYLKLLFPAKGQTKPALRFAGFEDEWKEVKLGEVTDIKTGGRDVQDSVEDGLYPFYIRSEEVKRINSYSFDGEAILIPGEGRLGEIFHYANGKFDVHQRVYKISNFTDVNAKFVLQQMKKDFKQHAMRNTVKATVDSLRLPTIQSFNILVPSLPEQTAIGSFFQDLDKAIAKQEGKVNQLKESKQTLLRKMFI